MSPSIFSDVIKHLKLLPDYWSYFVNIAIAIYLIRVVRGSGLLVATICVIVQLYRALPLACDKWVIVHSSCVISHCSRQ